MVAEPVAAAFERQASSEHGSSNSLLENTGRASLPKLLVQAQVIGHHGDMERDACPFCLVFPGTCL